MALLSVLIPARGERFLEATVRDVLAKAQGELEVIVVLDGTPANLPIDPRLTVLQWGAPRGMRPSINAAVRVAKGRYLMKLDGHCMVAPGFDLELAAACDGDWVVVPRRHRLDAEAWMIDDGGKAPIDAHYLSNPWERPGDPSCGLHGTVWPERAKARRHIPIDDEMSSQGSCWFMSRGHWDRLGEMDAANYGNFIQEFQELGLKTWLGGGAVKVNKRTWYAHLHKGKRYGRGYFISKAEMQKGADYATAHWMADRRMQGLVERFAPVPGWPADLDRVFHAAA